MFSMSKRMIGATTSSPKNATVIHSRAEHGQVTEDICTCERYNYKTHMQWFNLSYNTHMQWF